MAESPPQGGAPPDAGDEATEPREREAKKGESDPLFNPPMLKTRKTVMGLAPAPHLGGASNRATEAEARKQRVLARIAALDAKASQPPPAPDGSSPPPGRSTPSGIAAPTPFPVEPLPPPFSGPAPGPTPAPGAVAAFGSSSGNAVQTKQSNQPQNKIVEETYIGPSVVHQTQKGPAGGGAMAGQVTTIIGGDPGRGNAPATPAPPPPQAAPPTHQSRTVIQAPQQPPARQQPPAHQSKTVVQAVVQPPPQQRPIGEKTAVMQVPKGLPTPDHPLTLPQQRQSSDNKIPAARPPVGGGWRGHDSVPEVPVEVVEKAPTTKRMMRTATPAEPAPPPMAALAVRKWEPPVHHHAVSGPLDDRLILLLEPHSPRAASFRILRDSLVGKNLPRVLAVTSAIPNDGKTTCAANLALALSEQSATKVLLVDGNFYDPEIGKIFGVERLTPMLPPDAAVWLPPYTLVEVRPNFHVAGIVRKPGEPPPRFEQQRFDGLIDRLVRIAYDYIIIDTPAMRGTPAVMQIVATADAALLAVRAGGTTTRDLRRAVEQLPKDKALGIALIDTPPQR